MQGSLFRASSITGIFILATLGATHVLAKNNGSPTVAQAQMINLEQSAWNIFQESIKIGDANQARQSYSMLSLEQKTALLPMLQAFSERNYTLAQWFYMDALFLNQQLQEAGKWLYIAHLGTRLDAQLCLHRPRTLEEDWVNYFPNSLSTLRSRTEERLDWMMQARFFHELKLDVIPQPAWVCLMYRPIIQPANSARLDVNREINRRMKKHENWHDERQRTYRTYLKDTGIDQIPDRRLNPTG